MSAPATSDPVAVTTADGTSWVRRAVTRDGRGLYAVDGSCQCPEFLLVPLSELAVHGIRGMADALPMPVPVVPEPQPPSVERLAEIEALAEAATAGPWCTDAWEIYQGAEYVPGISFWIGETCRGTSELGQDRADAAFVAAARSDVPELVAEVRRQAAQIAELEAQRERRRVRLVALSNDALNMRGALSPMGEERKVPMPLGETLLPAVEWLIGRVAELEALTPARVQTCRVCGAGYTFGEPCSSCEFRTRMAAELQARGLDGEHYPFAHHDYRVGHDLPETGGV
ncbi:hypothetical protein PV728_29695 [Streptomyces europaeiscabiei]|uniref:hypothetical protein n=1 Tax=Streptomyces europaeiscabiei TaxID=146819 RepID=UPI0029B2AABA|nr:hypothetical protein [Streptomyces europaeiscabiei]MDX3634366.1 hypothetical protein [Streptomyces europaeiscabiei]MDX3651786.1 hypothetical protein [Streptomyces europaeiscabiei]